MKTVVAAADASALSVLEEPRVAQLDGSSVFLAWSIAIILGLLPVWIQERLPKESRSVDFVYFYAVSQIVHNLRAESIYDHEILAAACQKIVPLRDEKSSYGPFQYPPITALLLEPGAKVPFWESFRIEQAISFVLYAAGIIILLRTFFPSQPLISCVFLPFACAYLPWVSNTFLNGQLSAFGFFSIALALALRESKRLFSSGLALSLCLYKPTLLLLLVPMLLLRRQFRVLAGVAGGGSVLIASTTAAFGWHVWAAYVRFLGSAGSIVQLRQLRGYVDLTAFVSLLAGTRAGMPIAAICTLAGLTVLIGAWLRNRDNERLAWASAITSTLFLGPYVPLYDTILIIPSLIASGEYLHCSGKSALPALLLLGFVSAWLSAALASTIHFQLLTLVIVAVSWLQVRQAGDRRGSPPFGSSEWA